ncbi:corrinoid protein [Methanomassiliicoccus luminyensis]|jgi:trimethylamine corrinoid protein|uniref:corrinoid protein n=1 Tax=Methanomassiliicoccus luminyensis TaxID=1080712 RepID=UPI00047525BA|nr:B12-binding domain-containing protein [Methanomassiliicoccus luminyensis]
MANKDQILEDARNAVLEYDADAAVEAAQASIKAGISPVDMIQDGFSKAMNEVGAKFGEKKLFLPHVIAAAEAMTKGIEVLTPELEKQGTKEGPGLGTVVIGTIEGDIHSIGKDIVAIMLKIAGFNVMNLGRDIPVSQFIDVAKKNDARVIGTSALMTSTMVNQIRVEELLKEEGLKSKIKTMVGGAPVTQQWADQIGADLYAENATDSVNRLKAAL